MKQEDKERNYKIAEQLLSEQNFGDAIKVGALMMLFGAFLYSVITAKASFSFGFVAAGIGIGVGLSMQHLGKGIETKFAVAAAVFTIVGCILGKTLAVIVLVARFNAPSMHDIFPSDAWTTILDQFSRSFSWLDLLYWFVAVWFAVFLVKRPLSRADRLALGLYELKHQEAV